MKKSIFLFFAAILCAMSVGAVNMTGGEVLYLTPNSNWLQEGDGKAPRFAAYFYGTGEAWESMTAVEGETNLYQLSVPAGNWTNVIFCRMNGNTTENSWGNKYNQTNDLVYDGTKNHYTVTEGAWSNGDGTWSTYTPNAPKTYKDITFTITANAAPQIHYWDGGDKMVGSVWENLPTMTATGNANEYTYIVKDVDEAKGVKYLLKIGNIQTADQHTTENVTADFKDLMPEVYVKGVTGWTGDGHKMTIADDYTSASVTITLAANLTADLKLTIGGNWMGDAKNAITKENNSSVFDTNSGQNGSIKTDIAGDYVFTYTYADQTLTVTYPTEEIEVAVDCYVTGNTALTGEDWVLDSENLKMTKVEGTEKYTYTFTALPANTAFELKVVYAGSQKGFSSLSEAIDGVTANGDNICFTLEETGDVTVTYDAETEKIALTGNFAIPVTYDYYIAGTLAGGWSATQQGMEKEDDVYKHTFSELNAGIYEFKITDGQFNTEEDKTHEHTTLGAAYKEVSYNEGNIKIVTEEAKNITVIFDATKDKITFEGLTPVVVTYQLKGVGGWDQPGIELVQNPDPEKASEYMLTCQVISADDAIKVVRLENGEIKDYYGNGTVKDGVEVTVEYDDQANIKLPAGTYNFYFDTNEPEKKLWIAAATDCQTVTEITLTEGDNSSALATEGVVTVTVDRDFEKDNLYTIALPFTINNAASVFGNGTVVYNFANLAYDKTNEEYILGFTKVSKIEAGKPYLIEPGQNVNGFVAENVTLSSATSISQKVKVDNVEKTATMTAVLSETTTGGSYWLAEDRYLYNGEVNMPALRALFVLPTTPSGMPARARVALKEDAATGVEDLFTTDAPVKVIVNGQLIIIRDGEMYNVQGQLVK